MEKEKMNLYAKIQKVRTKLTDQDIKKSGKNIHSHFTYFELSDFLPPLNRLLDEYGLMTKFSLTQKKDEAEIATLRIFDSAEPEKFEDFIIPSASVNIGVNKEGKGGAQPIQNLGGRITYLRRYLLMAAFEIAENDAVDAGSGSTKQATKSLSLSMQDQKAIAMAKTVKDLQDICNAINPKITPALSKVLRQAYEQKKAQLLKSKKEKASEK